MAVSEIHIDARPDEVFSTLLDPWSYAHWVVGSKAIRDVDDDWPKPGSAFHHRVGVGPVEVWDRTRVVALEVGKMIALDARVWPTGENRVVVQVEPDGAGSRVVLRESPLRGPLKLVDNPLLQVATRVRNDLALARLRKMVEQRATIAGPDGGPTGTP